MKTLIITDSWDATSDIVINRLGNNAFRVNTDLIRDYKVAWDASGFRMSNPSGRTLTSLDVSSVYWRKPFTSEAYADNNHADAFFFNECRYLVREMYNTVRAHGAYALVEEGAERRLGKIQQLLIAKDYFLIPEWKIMLGHNYVAPAFTVAKSLSGSQIDPDNVLYTTRIDAETLDPAYIWFTQRALRKTADVTVCYVKEKIFAFSLPAISGITDWRSEMRDSKTQEWRSIELPELTIQSIRNFMRRCNLHYGRLDFVYENNQLQFLEVNPNGQWAWLDLEDKIGLITAIIQAIQGHSAISSLLERLSFTGYSNTILINYCYSFFNCIIILQDIQSYRVKTMRTYEAKVKLSNNSLQ